MRKPGILLAGVSTLALTCGPLASPSAADGWRRLYRPLHIPHVPPGQTCPVSRIDTRVPWSRINIFGESGLGRGPVYPGLGGSGGHVNVTADVQYGGPWLGGKVFWYVLPSYRGRVLIRGRELDGGHIMRFNAGKLPRSELRIAISESVSWPGRPPGSRGVPSGIRVVAPGCYGVQIDGTRFSRMVVFQVI
jgi:hypothetical protein